MKEHLMQAYDFDMIKWISEEAPNPPDNTPGVHARVMKIQPFSIAARKRFNIDVAECHDYGEISETVEEQKTFVSPEFEEYFAQNYKNQFYFDQRECNMVLKRNFLDLVNGLFKLIDE